MEERESGWHRMEDSVVLWEIREAFMGEMALDLNFAGHGISQVEEEGRKRHGLYPSLLSLSSLLTPFFIYGGWACVLGVVVFEHDLVVCVCGIQ